jgi:hypothetical protein
VPVPIVPLISGTSKGPLGIAHLPRLWLKLLLSSRQLLAAGYRHGVGGTDAELFEMFGIDGDAMIAFIERSTPDYPDTEAWFRENAEHLSDVTRDAFNEHMRTFEFNEARKIEWLARFGLDGSHYTAAVLLNQLDDWEGAFAQLGTLDAPVVPLISSSCAGPMGFAHLPRLWWKTLLQASGKAETDEGPGASPLDRRLIDALGSNGSELLLYLDEAQPSYLATEQWLRDHLSAARLEPANIAEFNRSILPTAILASDLTDWSHLRASIVAWK